MNTDTDIWFAFARTFGMLFVVLAFFLLVFYLFRRFSGVTGGKGSRNLIQVLAVHHLSPKEKLVLVSVLKENILIGLHPSVFLSWRSWTMTRILNYFPKKQVPGFLTCYSAP